jgi:uncharacterized protein YijF (DUF1287 family)
MKKIALPTFVLMAIMFSAFAACKNSNSKIFPENITEENTIQYPINNNINNGIYKAAVEFANSVSWTYDPAYYKIPYPNGDVPSGGACTDVIIRVLRKNNIDLQQLIHEDISSNFDAYPNKWGLSSADANIDHRRVPNIMKYFERNGFSKSITKNAIDYQPGDIITWELSPGITHIGIVLENEDIFHNMGPSSRIESGFLFSHKILGHYRI